MSTSDLLPWYSHTVYDIHTKILTVHLPEQSKNSLLHSEAEFASKLSFTYKNQILSYSKSLLFYSIISLTQAVVNRNYFSSYFN